MEEIRFIENPTLYKIRNKSVMVISKPYRGKQLYYINVGSAKRGQYLSLGVTVNGIAIKVNNGNTYGYKVTENGLINCRALVFEIANSFCDNLPAEYSLSFNFDKLSDGIEYYKFQKKLTTSAND